ncbi:VanZ family protein [Actomonas aquatica]|uniref:VanZ family protein n=1 Tax=Actomonas aquatica TaxID=2866162 RepID=A0ABZ1C7H2_9BACT|nr:VanZ family protein [Opitutus sp. WL0086]WRQ87378.1 VanZ family protein [Opitutus sp. WL0086]
MAGLETDTDKRGHWGWPVALAVMVFFASGRGSVAAPDIVNIDKLTHFAVFGLLATLVARTQPRRRWWLGLVVASLYGMADEFRQSFTPGRSVEVADWVADTLGAAVAVTVYARWTFYRQVLERNLGGGARLPVAKPESVVPDSAQ